MNIKSKNTIRKILKRLKINKSEIFSYLRISFCILLAAIWVIWLACLPDKEKHTKPNIMASKEQINIEIKENIPEPIKIETKNEIIIKKEEITSKTIIAKNIPAKEKKIENRKEDPIKEIKGNTLHPEKKQTITAENKNEIKVLATPQNTPKSFKEAIHTNIHLPNTAIATRKVLAGDDLQGPNIKNQNDIPLRKKISIEMIQGKEIFQNNSKDTLSNGSWLPKYLIESKELKSKIEKLNENLDEIATQLEVTGIISKPGGKSAVLIRNKATNKTKLLNKGEKYLSLTILEINQNEVVLGDENLNKKYIKRFTAR